MGGGVAKEIIVRVEKYKDIPDKIEKTGGQRKEVSCVRAGDKIFSLKIFVKWYNYRY